MKLRAKVSLPVQADASKEARFRAVVSYRGTKHPAKSAAARVNYWHWQGLSGRYYTAGYGSDVIGFNMVGKSWKAGTSSAAPALRAATP